MYLAICLDFQLFALLFFCGAIRMKVGAYARLSFQRFTMYSEMNCIREINNRRKAEAKFTGIIFCTVSTSVIMARILEVYLLTYYQTIMLESIDKVHLDLWYVSHALLKHRTYLSDDLKVSYKT